MTAEIDLADIRAFNTKRGPQCSTCRALAKMNPKLRKKVEAALLDREETQAQALSQWLSETHKIEVPYYSIARHRRGICRRG